MDSLICSECREPSYGVWRNFGHGVTEYWGAVSCHENWCLVSKCCSEDLVEPEEEEND
jgi:hypothetical protein